VNNNEIHHICAGTTNTLKTAEQPRMGGRVGKSNGGGSTDLGTIYLRVNAKAKIPLKNEDNDRQESKTGHVKGRALVGGGV
jgi:hypothetical protein